MKKFLLVSGTLVIAATHAYLQAGYESAIQQLKVRDFTSSHAAPTFDEMMNKFQSEMKNESLSEIANIINDIAELISSNPQISPYTVYSLIGALHELIEEKVKEDSSIHGAPTPSANSVSAAPYLNIVEPLSSVPL